MIKKLQLKVDIECDGENCGECEYRQITTHNIFKPHEKFQTICGLFNKVIYSETTETIERLPECLKSEVL